MATNLAPVVTQPHPGRADEQFIGMSDRARLIALFDLIALSRIGVDIWTDEEPDAPAALRAWAAARALPLEDHIDEDGDLSIVMHRPGSQIRMITIMFWTPSLGDDTDDTTE